MAIFVITNLEILHKKFSILLEAKKKTNENDDKLDN